MKSLTLIFYATVTFMVGVIALSSMSIGLESVVGVDQARMIQGVVLVLMIAVPIAFLAAIPFLGSRRSD
jgi:hypothetical protein